MTAIFILVLTACMLCGYAALHDLRAMRIPNRISLELCVLFIPVLALKPELAGPHMTALAIMTAIGLSLYLAGLWGGGDMKLVCAASLWVGLAQLPLFLMVVTCTGGLLGLLGLWGRAPLARMIGPDYKLTAGPLMYALPTTSWPARLARGENAVPYGVAIATGMATCLLLNNSWGTQ